MHARFNFFQKLFQIQKIKEHSKISNTQQISIVLQQIIFLILIKVSYNIFRMYTIQGLRNILQIFKNRLLMIPKRKLIKKRYLAPPNSELTTDGLSIDNIPEQLQSPDPKIRLDAVAALANLEEIDEELLIPSVLIDIIKTLYDANPSLVHSSLFAIANICQLQPSPTVQKLFEQGLDKALVQINSSDANLVKPIIVLITAICNYVPPAYKFLVTGIQKMIVTGALPVHQHHGKEANKEGMVDLSNPFLNPEYSDLVLELLMRTEYSFQNSENPANQHAIVNTLITIAETHKSFKTRAMAARVLIALTRAHNLEHIGIFTTLAEEMLNDLDLQRQFQTSVSVETPQQQHQGGLEQMQVEDNEEDQPMMDQQHPKNTKNQGNNNKKVMYDQIAYTQWLDALQGIEIVLELVKQVLENQNNYEDQGEGEDSGEQIGEGEEEMGGQQIQENQNKGNEEWNNQIVGQIITHVLNTCKKYQKFVNLSFVEGQPIIELILNILLSLPNNVTASDPAFTEYVVYLAQKCLVSLFQNQMKYPRKYPIEYLTLNANLCLQIVLKNKRISQRSIYIELPTLSYNIHEHQGEKIMGVKHIWKECWLTLMEIYSMFFNPEKNPVSPQENTVIGNILKHLILNIPEMELEEWRGQVIDTLFDVYSNQNFDNIFMELNFVGILSEISKMAKTTKSKTNKKNSKKENKFITAVLSDIARFLEYKKKMIGF